MMLRGVYNMRKDRNSEADKAYAIKQFKHPGKKEKEAKKRFDRPAYYQNKK